MARDERSQGTPGSRLDECSVFGFSSVTCLIKSLLTRSYSFQGNTVKNAGWDFSVGGSQSIGTVRALKPPQARERRQDVSSNQISQRTTRASGNQWPSATGSTISEASEGGFIKRHPFQNDHEDGFHEEVRSFLLVCQMHSAYLTRFLAVTVAPENYLLKHVTLCMFHVTWVSISSIGNMVKFYV